MATHSSILAWRITIDRGTWRATVHEVTKSQTQLSDSAQHSTCVYVYMYYACIVFSKEKVHIIPPPKEPIQVSVL